MKISNLVKVSLTSGNIENCIYVKDIKTSTISMSEVFDWIKQHSIEKGLTVELRGDKIIFIKHNI